VVWILKGEHRIQRSGCSQDFDSIRKEMVLLLNGDALFVMETVQSSIHKLRKKIMKKQGN
jgi:hypothetical protein